MALRKYTDWRSWWQGLQTNLIKCIGTTGTAWLGSNAVASTGIPFASNIGMNYKQAIGLFAVHIGIEVFAYMKNVQPQVITETVETATKVSSPDGSEVSQSSKITTTTPVPPAQPPQP